MTTDLRTEPVRLAAHHVRLAYDERVVVDDLDLELTEGSFTAIVGPNGCGKSTLLRALGRLMRPASGQVLLDGRAIARTPTREVAKVLGLLPQAPVAPEGGKDLSGVEIVGTSYGQIDLEQLAAADPDVIVASVYPTDSEGALDPETPMYGFESIEQQEQVAEIAPIIAIAWRGSAADVIERTAELAGALGADLDGAEVSAARDDFEAASAALTAAAAGGITVLPVYATESDGWWMARAADDPSLHLYQDLGVQFVDPGGEDYFWNSVGWEDVPNHPSDVLLYSLRLSMGPQELAAQPTAALLPAVRAGQVHPWKYLGMDYAAQAAYMQELAGWLTEAQKVT